MTKHFWGFLGVGLAVVAIVVAMVWTSTKPNHLDIDGKIIRVRTMALGERTLVLVDFRVTNTSGVPLVTREVSMKIDQNGKPALDGVEVSKPDVDVLFDAHPQLAPKYNDVLAPPDQIAPGKTLDRMAEASFEAPLGQIDSRKGVIVHIEDVDGAEFDIAEKK